MGECWAASLDRGCDPPRTIRIKGSRSYGQVISGFVPQASAGRGTIRKTAPPRCRLGARYGRTLKRRNLRLLLFQQLFGGLELGQLAALFFHHGFGGFGDEAFVAELFLDAANQLVLLVDLLR
ncbi:hypothetical protein GA0071314_3121 [Halomonas sp. HL-93]|nr:MAG: hypothetical protein HLUCCA13_04765 [Halomonas sp. HL-48]SBR51306.1 hypothetical protein GA0071314_3121 [Halomonas sp. HL-93]